MDGRWTEVKDVCFFDEGRPKTGDDSNGDIWLAVTFIFGSAAAAAIIRRRKQSALCCR